MDESEFKEKAAAMNLSLDEYIRRYDFRDQFCLMKHRKRDKNIDPEVLDMSLNEYIQSNPSLPRNADKGQSSECGRFNRRSLRDDDSSDDEDGGNKRDSLDMDVVMKTLDAIKEEDDGEDLNGLHFSTVESRNGIRVRPQQWRLLPENLEDRPPGVQRLEVLPLDENERYKRVRNGKVRKRKNRSRTSSLNTSIDSDVTTGTFIEKRRFTYKIGDRNKDGHQGLIGIERAKHFSNAPESEATVLNQPININMNWNGFFQGFRQCVDTIRGPAAAENNNTGGAFETETDSVCDKLMALLQAKRAKESAEKSVQQNIADIQGRSIVFTDDPEEDNPIVMDTSGNRPRTTKLPINVRFI